MAPYTAEKLRDNRKNTLKDFIHVGAPLGVTHFLIFTATEKHTNLKIARLPRGPTLSFHVEGFTLMRHMHEFQRHPVDPSVLSLSIRMQTTYLRVYAAGASTQTAGRFEQFRIA